MVLNLADLTSFLTVKEEGTRLATIDELSREERIKVFVTPGTLVDVLFQVIFLILIKNIMTSKNFILLF